MIELCGSPRYRLVRFRALPAVDARLGAPLAAYDVEFFHDIRRNAEQLPQQGLVECLPVGVVITLVRGWELQVAEPLKQILGLAHGRLVELASVYWQQRRKSSDRHYLSAWLLFSTNPPINYQTQHRIEPKGGGFFIFV